MGSDQQSLASQWRIAVQGARSNADAAISRIGADSPFCKLIMQHAEAFCGLPVPATKDEFVRRQTRRLDLIVIVGSVEHAASSADQSPQFADVVLDATKAFSEKAATDYSSHDSLRLTNTIEAITVRS